VNDFELAVGFVLSHEGGADGSPHTDPDDPGGATRWGIAQRYHPSINVLTLTREEAVAIYRHEYWGKYGCGAMPFPLSVLHFDSCVNPGPGRAAQFKAIARNPHDYLLRRIGYYLEKVKESPVKAKFLRGWLVRCMDLHARFLA
jgi:lysozyme family protein